MGESWGKGVLEEREIYPDDMNIVPACLATTDLHPNLSSQQPPSAAHLGFLPPRWW